MQFVLLVGDVKNGLEVVGPFDSSEEAINYGDLYENDSSWVLSELIEPTYFPERTV